MENRFNLTSKQKKVLDFIRERIENNIPPTIREIGRKLGFSSTGTVRDYLKALEEKGYLRRINNKSRHIELLRDSSTKIPIIASITAGKPDLAYEDIEGYLEPRYFLCGRKDMQGVFALRVKGDSMQAAGIMEGDIAVVRKQLSADNGDIIAAMLDNQEVTLKRFRRKGNTVFLEPANVNYQPIYNKFTVIGKLIAIVRKYI